MNFAILQACLQVVVDSRYLEVRGVIILLLPM